MQKLCGTKPAVITVHHLTIFIKIFTWSTLFWFDIAFISWVKCFIELSCKPFLVRGFYFVHRTVLSKFFSVLACQGWYPSQITIYLTSFITEKRIARNLKKEVRITTYQTRSLLNCVPYVFTCQRVLRAHVLMCQRVSKFKQQK